MPEHIIDCDADPYVPFGWSVLEHRRSGTFAWDPSAVELFVAKKQREDGMSRASSCAKS